MVFAHPALEIQISDLSRAINLSPDASGLYLRRGLLHQRHGYWDLAKQDFEAARALVDSADVQVALGNLYLAEGDPERASVCFAEAIKLS
jgi:uncharacterized protein HemY